VSDADDTKAAIIASLADEHGARWDYSIAVSEYCIGLTPHEADLFTGAMDLYDAVQAALEEGLQS